MLIGALQFHVQNNYLGLLCRDDLSPVVESLIGDCAGANSPFDIMRQHVSHYASDHWADLDPDLPDADREAAGGVVRLLRAGIELVGEIPPGIVLDMGCSTGRTTFELAAQTDDLALGIDLSMPMLRVAARALQQGRVRYGRRRVGMVYDRRDYAIDMPGSERVDFWHCDVLALPFMAERFAFLVSLNVLDCLSSPVTHLQSLGALMSKDGRALLSSPFDWSPTATTTEGWIGGHSQRGPEGGSSEKMLRRLLAGGEGQPGLGLTVLAENNRVPWGVRLHERSTAIYHSHLVLLERAAQ